MYHCTTIKSNVLHRFASNLESLSCKNIPWSIEKIIGLNIYFEKVAKN